MAKIELEWDSPEDEKQNTIERGDVDQEFLKEELREIYEQLGKVLNMPSSRQASRGKMFWASYTRSLAKRMALATEAE